MALILPSVYLPFNIKHKTSADKFVEIGKKSLSIQLNKTYFSCSLFPSLLSNPLRFVISWWYIYMLTSLSCSKYTEAICGYYTHFRGKRPVYLNSSLRIIIFLTGITRWLSLSSFVYFMLCYPCCCCKTFAFPCERWKSNWLKKI